MKRCNCVSHFQNGTERIEDYYPVTRPHYVGKHILLCGRRSQTFPYHCMIGPDWHCMLVTYALIIIPTFFFIYDVGYAIGWWVYLVGSVSGIAVLVLFSMTACSDPGIIYDYVPQKDIEMKREFELILEEGLERGATEDHPQSSSGSNEGVSSFASVPSRRQPLPSVELMDCGSCGMKRPTSASHCYDCGLCIDEIDHHCPWTGKCIGKKNIRVFYWFLAALSLHILIVLSITIYSVLMKFKIFRLP